MNRNLVRQSIQGSVLVLRMQAMASRNALSRSLLAGLLDSIRAPQADILSIVVTGGDDCFSAGADFHELDGTREDAAYDDAVSQLTDAIMSSDRVVVAAIEGPCLGAAADVALSCDFRVAGAGSYIQIPAVYLGLLYKPEAVARLAHRYPGDTVRRLLLAGERFAAHDARRAGLFSRVVPRGSSLAVATRELQRLGSAQADALRASKQLLSQLEAGKADMAHWQRVRLELLDSGQRRAAIQQARERHVLKSSPSSESRRSKP